MISLGIDTSNYTTSAAIFDGSKDLYKKCLINVPKGHKGMRQSNVLFEHIKKIGGMLEELFKESGQRPDVIGVSVKPVEDRDSYMPCFLAGVAVALSMAAALGVEVFRYTHRQNHIAAALYSTSNLEWMEGKEFLAFHLSGGTTDWLYVKTSGYKFKEIVKLGGSKDLKAGQLIDRVGLTLDLNFPSGQELDKLALKYRNDSNEDFKISVNGRYCNLSGIENLANKLYKKAGKEKTAYFTIKAIIDTLEKIINEIKKEYPNLPILFIGGVCSNTMIKSYFKANYGALFAEPRLSCDNATGVAVLSYLEGKRRGDL